MELLNEYMSDQFMERFSDLLSKQYTEKEQMLKAILQKYTDMRMAEEAGIKAQFKIDYENLEMIKDRLDLNDYTEQLKMLRLNESNLTRTASLTIEKTHKDEESQLRKELEKKQNSQQLEFK